MTDVRILSEAEASSVQFLKNCQLTLSLDKKFANSVSLGITKTLASKYLEFEPSLNGVLLNKECCRNVSVVSSANDDVGSFQVTFEADVYVFVPAAGDHLSVKVRKDHGKVATAEALQNFNVIIQKGPKDRNLEAGMTVLVRIVSVAYTAGVPDIIGDFVSVQEVQADISQPAAPRMIEGSERSVAGREVSSSVPGARKPVGRGTVKLPGGFTLLRRKTSKGSLVLEYRGPDGRKYSRKEIDRISRAEDEKMIETESSNVEQSWKITEDGNLAKNKKKFYHSKSPKTLPKKSLYYMKGYNP